MGIQVVLGALCVCDVGQNEEPLMVELPFILADGMPAATIVEGVSYINIIPFGECEILTAEAEGPTDCEPSTAVWAPGAINILMEGIPALDDLSVLQCAVGGTIMVIEPGQFSVILET